MYPSLLFIHLLMLPYHLNHSLSLSQVIPYITVHKSATFGLYSASEVDGLTYIKLNIKYIFQNINIPIRDYPLANSGTGYKQTEQVVNLYW